MDLPAAVQAAIILLLDEEVKVKQPEVLAGARTMKPSTQKKHGANLAGGGRNGRASGTKGERAEKTREENEKMSPILRRTKIPRTFIPQLLGFASRSIKSFRFPGEPLDSSSITYGVHVFQCPDARGIVAKLSDCIASRGGNILGADVFVPENKEVFYSRSEFIFDYVKWPRAQMEEDFMKLSRSFNATRSVVRVPDLDPKYKIAVLASKQVLSGKFLRSYEKDVINIHHGLLPSFKGGFPSKQAFDAGVKLIGATSHFVTEELDSGPIIEQMVPVAADLYVNTIL
ncbi:unnamed protein product [Linum tenue]|uniref:ACT domain-containing protein n=1 Tax=Linum tenue TaxID=586396 RepID=A0AAV0Q275_9ROSI|nr:unnamed protein product [Linum tenue]